MTMKLRFTTHGSYRLVELCNELGLVQEGDFRLSSGDESNYYFDGRLLSLNPEGLELVSKLMYPMLESVGAEAVGGLELGAVPITAGVVQYSQGTRNPMSGFIVRKNRKENGTRQIIEGKEITGKRVAIVDDVCTAGTAIFRSIEAVELAGANVVKVVTVLDRNEGGANRLRSRNYDFSSLLISFKEG